MKTVMALAAAGLLGQALWTFGGETYLVAAAALTETHTPDSSADYSARALAGEPVLFAVEPLKTRQDRTALRAARELIREGELERAHHYLGLVDTKHAAAAAEAEALALSMTPRRVELIQAQLDQGKPEAALQAIARAEVTLPGTPAMAPATLVSLKAQALNQVLKAHLQAGHVSALMDVAQDYPKGKRSANPSTHSIPKLRTLRPLRWREGRGDHGSRTTGTVFGAGGGLPGLGPEGQGVGPGQWGVAVGLAELVRARRALAGAAGRC